MFCMCNNVKSLVSSINTSPGLAVYHYTEPTNEQKRQCCTVVSKKGETPVHSVIFQAKNLIIPVYT